MQSGALRFDVTAACSASHRTSHINPLGQLNYGGPNSNELEPECRTSEPDSRPSPARRREAGHLKQKAAGTSPAASA